MTLATLAEVLGPANAGGYAVAGLVCLGWEDARAYRDAAEHAGLPVILQVGPGARAHMPLTVWAPMLRGLAETASVPVVVHLDHGSDPAECSQAIDLGFSSVMYDGSRLPLNENIAVTAEVAQMASRAGVSSEGEVGFVGYDAGEASLGTDPDEAARFAAETGVDAVAVSVGNVHLQQEHSAEIDTARLAEIAAKTDVPLVIHGGSGLDPDLRTKLARETAVAKFNIGTELRMAFGAALRDVLAEDSALFDRLRLLSEVETRLQPHARRVIEGLGPAPKS